MFEEANVYVKRMAATLADKDKEAVRIAKKQCMIYNRLVYTINTAFAQHADNGIIRGLELKIHADDPDAVYTALRDILYVSTTTTNALLAVTRQIDISYVTQIAVAMCKCYTNPNLYSVILCSMPLTYDFNLSVVTGFFVIQTLFHSSMIKEDQKIYI